MTCIQYFNEDSNINWKTINIRNSLKFNDYIIKSLVERI